MTKLLEDEDSADEEFWGQDAFAEESDDNAYESESEKEDVFDSTSTTMNLRATRKRCTWRRSAVDRR